MESRGNLVTDEKHRKTMQVVPSGKNKAIVLELEEIQLF